MNNELYGQFVPNSEIMATMLAMGINKDVAEIALYNTGNNSPDAAISYVFDNPNEYSVVPNTTQAIHSKKKRIVPRKKIKKKETKQSEEGQSGDEDDEDTNEGASKSDNPPGGISDEEYDFYKMVFVINSGLEMSIGKIASQVAHASLGLYRILINETDKEELVNKWEDDGETKVVLKGFNHLHLIELQTQANLIGLNAYLVQDAGNTEVAPGSITVLSIFGSDELVNSVTGDLVLF